MKQFANDTEYKIHWLRRASIELETIYRFYGQPFHILLVVANGKIIHSVGLLGKMPCLGKKDKDFTHIREYRYLVVLSYKIYYFIETDNVYIASIWDCRQGRSVF